ncbi:type IV toxin-antitoxin system AbiEi family antitoxin domain-containing protein [Nocardia xishanensis]|uniref:type IV toxin-antitoxin system AbiEi family antitoxin domain-containing protein n=1 Tax=Nocardia xishanensis TaxID=238964 RepID=UPI00082BFC84|nr:type IV toxin-antitoxin system AbiEi family antitoxin domain-containing protein [Nocardia xishanensis]
MSRDERLLDLADLAGSQWGLFTSMQAGDLGFSTQQLKRLADAELITRLRQGVYRLTGAPETPQDPIRAEWLALEPKRLAADRLADAVPVGVVSHRSAARLQDLGDIDADFHEFTVPKRRSTRSPDVKFHVRELGHEDWHLVAGLPATRPLRTTVDLAATRTDGGHLASVARDAILTEDTTRDELAAALRPYAHYYGMPIGAGDELLRNFIGQAGVPESAKALTRSDRGVDWVLIDPTTNRPIALQSKFFERRPLEFTLKDIERRLADPGFVEALLTALRSSSADTSRMSAALGNLVAHSKRPADNDAVVRLLLETISRLVRSESNNDEDGGGDDGYAEVPERPGVSSRDQSADQ